MSDDVEFEALKRSSALQLLMKCGRLANEVALARFRVTSGHASLRAAHTNLFPHIDLGGTRLTEIARRLGHSKQSVAQLVDELVEMGILERVPDPNDGRAKLVRFLGGAEALSRGVRVLIDLEAEIAEALGRGEFDRLHRSLAALEVWFLEADAPEGPG